ncbi:hypothetical protein ANCCEY_12361 [Ancylostoma ceylanicum]|uniref:Integrase catalytic domain-containing protein n=1 Tax=Ancylostoma ceylanicum TaxID=53326 RepID=A0A0D6L9V9_9BILA|nr:hypothetical protein ANCCEY_12361 [Ancylostoma ceylanicum]
MAGANPSLTIAKQRLTRHINDIKHLIHECERYQEGWKFPSTCKELFVFIRTQRSSSATDSPNIPQVLKDFHIYWEEKEGDDILEMARELIQSLDMRLVELSTQELQVSYADEFDHLERQRTTMTSSELPPLVTPFTSQVDAPISGPSNSIPAHWYKKELRIPEFYGNPTDFQSFWEIFSELVDKQPYTDIEKLTILLEKCKGEAARALKFLPRKGSSYNDAKKQLKEQFENEELNVKLLLEQLERIPPSTEDASQLRATINDIMAIITPLSRSETHIDAREYKAKIPVHNVAAQEDEVSSDEELIHIHRIRVSSDSSDPRLMIIVVPLVDHVSRERTEVYALLDSGATRSFISEALASRLHLPLGTCSSYVLTTFGGKQEKKKSHAVSAQAISKNEGIFSMSLLTSEKITEKITLPRLSPDDIQHAISNQISEHTVLNPCEIEIEPEILLGIDYYTEVIDTSVPPCTSRIKIQKKNNPFFAMLFRTGHNTKRSAAIVLKFLTKPSKSRNDRDSSEHGCSELYQISDSLEITATDMKLAEQVLIRDHYLGMRDEQRTYPEQPALPSTRVCISRPFEHVGIDYAGPFIVKVENSTYEKRWICLITCMSTRAIHLEVVDGLSATQFIAALRRFIARRGTPKSITSDNATTFVKGNAILQGIFANSSLIENVQNFVTNQGITWKFITPLSPWKGGFYERLIGSVKSYLRKTIRRKFVSDDEFRTVITECEAIVNARPLTYVSSDFRDANTLRAIDFLHPHAKITPWKFEPDYDPEFRLISTRKDASNLLTETKEALGKFWEQWTNSYLTTLQNVHANAAKSKSTRQTPQVGSLVFIMDDEKPRTQWKMGIIIHVHSDTDGNVRSVDARSPNGNIVTRSINMLIPLELAVSNDSENGHFKDAEIARSRESEQTKEGLRIQPSRKAKKNVTYAEDAQILSFSPTNLITNVPTLLLCTSILTLLPFALADHTTSSYSSNVEIQCVKGGILARNLIPFSDVQVCASNHCIETHALQSETAVMLPAHICLHEHETHPQTLPPSYRHSYSNLLSHPFA